MPCHAMPMLQSDDEKTLVQEGWEELISSGDGKSRETEQHLQQKQDDDDDDDDDDWVFVVDTKKKKNEEKDSLSSSSSSTSPSVSTSTARTPCSDSPLPPSTFGTIGKGERILEVGKEAILFDYTSPCNEDDGDVLRCLSHFWFGGNFQGVEDTRIRFYVDGESCPSIDMELYLGHGIGFHSNEQSPWITKYIGKVGLKNGIHNNYKIPFRRSIKVTAERSRGKKEDDRSGGCDSVPQSWWIIRGTVIGTGPLLLGQLVLPRPARLHLIKREQFMAQPLEEFDLCHIPTGIAGALFQVTIAAQSTNLTFLEACIRAYLQPPDQHLVMLSSGLEDYFLGTYYFDSGPYHSDISGLTHFDQELSRFSAYRFHGDQDPVIFNNGLRLTCRCGETEHGQKDGKPYLNPQPTTYTTYVWYYQW